LQKGRRIFEYRTRCVRLEMEPVPGGTRLTQREECEITAGMLEGLPVPRRAEHAWQAIKILSLVAPSLARETYAVILREHVEKDVRLFGRSWNSRTIEPPNCRTLQ
jgi:hypothetical protein